MATAPASGTVDQATTLAALNAASVKMNDNINASLIDAGKILDSANAANAQAQAATSEDAQAQVIINTVQMNARLKTQQRTASEAAFFGTDPDADTYMVKALGDDIRTTQADIMQRDKMINEKMNTSFFDDPISYIANQFSLPTDVASRNARVSQLEQREETLSKLNALTTEAGQKNMTIEQNITAATVNASNTKLLNAAIIANANSQKEIAQLGLTGINVRMAGNKQQFDAVVAGHNANVQEQGLSLQKAQFGLAQQREAREAEAQKSRLELDTLIKQSTIEDKQKKAESEALLQDKLNRATSTFSMAPITLNEFKLMSGKQRDKLEQMMMDPDVQNGRAGPTPAAALDTMSGLNIPGNPGLNMTRSKLIAIQVAEKEKLGQMLHSMKPEEVQMKVNKGIEDTVKKEANNIPAVGGFYSPPPLQKVLTIPAVAATSLAQELAVFGKDPQAATDANMIFRVANDLAAKDPSKIPQLANEIATIYAAINVDNNTTHQYNKLALPALPSNQFKTQVQTGKGWSGAEVINMANKVNVEATLIRAQSNKTSAYTFGATTGPLGTNRLVD